MNLLLDTDAVLWSLGNPDRLGAEARGAIEDPDNTVHVSAASAWEIAIKSSRGKLTLPKHAASWLPERLAQKSFVELPVRTAHALAVEQLPWHHRDPFDRLLVAQARVEKLTIVTSDREIARYDVRVLRT